MNGNLNFLTGSKVKENNLNYSEFTAWNSKEKFIFRALFLYFIIMSIPISWQYYALIISFNWLNSGYTEIFAIAHYFPDFFSFDNKFLTILFIFLFSIAGAALWSVADKKDQEYNTLYYWLRVAVRYRLSAALIAYGFIKLIPIQFPSPSLRDLNTSYGDFTDWQIFSLSLGVSPGYQSFLGIIEILAGVLFVFRKTVPVGAIITLLFTGNVYVSNLAYEGSESAYSFYILNLAFFLLIYDLPRIFTLLTLEKDACPNLFKVYWDNKVKKYCRLVLKTTFFYLFIFLYGYKVYSLGAISQNTTNQELSKCEGFYDVKEFRIGNKTFSYSEMDTIRWQDVIIEKPFTFSIRLNKNLSNDSNNKSLACSPDSKENYAFSYSSLHINYDYTADTIHHILSLKKQNDLNDRLVLNYQIPDSLTIILSFKNLNADSVHISLQKINKKYLLKEAKKINRENGIRF